jgi:adenylyltransferase/sulfurtransferase
MPSRNIRTDPDHRYSRQIRLPEIGRTGQKILGRSTVLVAGIGGLGSVSAFYLAAAGIGHLILVDPDQVSLSNLNRQLLHTEAALGTPKVVSGVATLSRLNTAVTLTPIPKKLTAQTLPPLLKNVDLVVDGCDNYPARQVINQACLDRGTAWVFGGVRGFGGMATLFVPGKTPCFECVIPGPGKKDLAGPDNGILGAAAGIIASIQALEAVKYLLTIGTSLAGRLARVSGLDMQMRVIDLPPAPGCLVCGKKEKTP